MNAGIKGQETINAPITSLFTEQLSLYPQEKIYVQTDRNVYMSGETVWFRAHLVDALFLKQANASRYVYVELINPLNDIVQRIKIRPDSIGCFYGHVLLEEDLPEGNYVLRAYTWFMQNQGEDYFFRKSIYITDPTREKIAPEVTFRPENNQMKAEISFVNKVTHHKVIPEQCLVFPDGDPEGKGIPLRFEDEKAAYTFKEREMNAARVILLQTLFDGTIYNSYFNVPAVDNTFQVDFFPEGGYAPFSANIKMAFKAINADGLSEEIEGEIFDDQGQAYSTFSSFHLGMGHFRMYYDPQRTYYAICKNKDNVSKRFDLPAASLNAVSLTTMWRDEYLRVTLAKSPQYELPKGLKVIAHIRGQLSMKSPGRKARDILFLNAIFFLRVLFILS
ncbi:MAG: MG2 domain-containing protein [Bacteroides sp.]|nr:MG2 domain-containing protein [Bacteroides sp.]